MRSYIRLTCTISPNFPTNVNIRPSGAQWETISAGKSASSGVESMNNAYQLARQKMAVDVLNGVISLLKLEAELFQRYKQVTWERDDILLDKGLKLMEECFTDV